MHLAFSDIRAGASANAIFSEPLRTLFVRALLRTFFICVYVRISHIRAFRTYVHFADTCVFRTYVRVSDMRAYFAQTCVQFLHLRAFSSRTCVCSCTCVRSCACVRSFTCVQLVVSPICAILFHTHVRAFYISALTCSFYHFASTCIFSNILSRLFASTFFNVNAFNFFAHTCGILC